MKQIQRMIKPQKKVILHLYLYNKKNCLLYITNIKSAYKKNVKEGIYGRPNVANELLYETKGRKIE